MKTTAKTTNELRFDALFTEYKILKRIDSETAVKNFTESFNLLVEDCAVKLYDGDVNDTTMHKALWNNLVSDKRTRFNNPERYFNGYLPEKTLKIELVELIASLLPDNARKVAPKEPDAKAGLLSKSFWQYTEAEVMAVTDVSVLESIYNAVSTAKSSATTTLIEAVEYFDLEDEDEALEYFGKIQKLVGKRKKALKQPVLSENLIAKLSKDGHTSLSAAEVAELRKLLGK